ncbi:NXPE family member 3-like [Ptychodera flava]|uniref:NXPE family member 3-like n=1 Tax=Ptychodera flava TaxID=63121 RepID=UPI003969F2F6
MMAEPPSFKLSVILRASLLVVLGVFLGIYVIFTGNSAYMGLKNDKGQTLANVHVEEESATVSQSSLHAESENNKVHRQQYDVKFPYNAYNRFCTGWNAIIEEYEWSYKHLRQESTYSGIYKSLSLGPESFTPISVSKSRVYLQDQTSTYRKGDFIQVIIEAKDEHGNPRLRGGDFLVGVMWNEKLQKYTAGRSVDYGNGTYSMFFYAAWKGAASINVTLSVPREAVLFYEQMKYKDHRILWSVKFTDGSITENSNCTISNEGTWDNKCSFENHRSMGKTAIICDKPKTLNCQTLNSTSQNLTAMATLANDAVAGLSYLLKGVSKVQDS